MNNHSGNPTGRRKSLLSLRRLRRHIVVPEIKYLLLIKNERLLTEMWGKQPAEISSWVIEASVLYLKKPAQL